MKLRKILASVLAVTLFCGTAAYFEYAQPKTLFVSEAADIVESGVLNSNISWTLDSEGTLTFTGSGDMPDYLYNSPFSYDEYSVNDYKDKIKTVIISDGITSVGNDAFNLSSLKKVVLADSVKRIGDRAFSACSDLEEINIPASVESIGSLAFINTKWLEEKSKKDPLVIVNGILIDGRECSGDVVIPDTAKAIAGGAFGWWILYGSANITSVTIPNTVKSIGENAFADCYNLRSVKMPDSVTSIGNYAFYSDVNLESIEIPASVTSIGARAFEDTKWFKNKIAEEGTVIINGTLLYCDPEGDYVVPDGVTHITFGSLDGSESINTKLKTVTIPKSVREIDLNTFMYIENVTAINVAEGNEAFSSLDGVLFNKNKTALIVYPKAKVSEEYVIPDTVETICSDAFYQAETKKVVIPDSVRNVEPYAFDICQMSEVRIPSTWTEIPDWSFADSRIETIDIPEGITRIGEGAFRGCVESVTLPSTLNEIGKQAFLLSDVKTITIPDGVTAINDSLFDNGDLVSISLPDTIKRIGKRAFHMCRDLEEIKIPDSVKTIDAWAFRSCVSLKSVEIPASVKSIGDEAFWGCDKLESVTILNPYCTIFDSSATISSDRKKRLDENGETVKDEKGEDKYFPYFTGTIIGYDNSTAQRYAKKYGYKFQSLGEAPVMGDANLDRVVNAKDASAILAEYSALSTGKKAAFNSRQTVNSDINRDGYINAADASNVLAFYGFLSTGGSGRMEDWLD